MALREATQLPDEQPALRSRVLGLGLGLPDEQPALRSRALSLPGTAKGYGLYGYARTPRDWTRVGSGAY
eukprot:CAMPEP_0182852768 /NCGR_PEP_ID=MMETSP0034_2-20130328/345_1 /TAXON_ID=156128 /ORGANISM="Nephroselmis pyriformis, Strain CCMP717" /LENGTH=68 /DNA_ID=CAMNT_0024983507 /DNA_START=182 /DNA_END=386 /DNA_ORIENTATION=+